MKRLLFVALFLASCGPRWAFTADCPLTRCNPFTGVCDGATVPCPRFADALTRPLTYSFRPGVSDERVDAGSEGPASVSSQEPIPGQVQGNGIEEPGTLLEWLKTHASIVSGVALANGERTEFVSLSIDTDFELSPSVRGFGNLTLFSRSRVTDEGSVPQAPGLPLSVDALAMYSAGQALGGVYRQVTPTFAVECRGGVVFQMIALTAHDVGQPVDGSKFIGGCGARLTGGPGRLSLLLGHAGPVTEGQPLMGFIPSLLVSGEFRLPKNASLLLDLEAGRDRATQQQVTSLRASVRKGF